MFLLSELSLSGVDLEAVYRQGRAIIDRLGRPKDLAAAKAMATALLQKPGSRYTLGILESFAVPDNVRRDIVSRWTGQGRPPILGFAPYTAHVATVDTFFCLALGAELIGRQRPSNRVDIAYLYYLPFCMGFTSNDNLHARTAQLFMDQHQVFVPGGDLKKDLAKLDAHYSVLPPNIKERGVMSFAHYPPTDGDFLTSTLWDKLMAPGWRDQAMRPERPEPEDVDRKLVAQIFEMRVAPRTKDRDFDLDSAEAVMFERKVPVRRGKWRLVPPEAAEEAGQDRPR
jgi:hypothetical protein